MARERGTSGRWTKATPSAVALSRANAIPKRIGKYRILRELGGGGMGLVYLAESRVHGRVALKVIRPELARDPEFRRRFAREAEVASGVSGAHVAPVLESDVYADTPFIASEYVEGPTLDAFVGHHGPLRADQLKGFALALAEALGAIHRCGLIHRDLKPSNILLTPAGPRVIDFGIAKATEATSLTGTGISLGTPAWMAPEQAKGSGATTASDVFAWGCLVAFAGSGSPPFGYGSAEAMLYRVVHEEPTLGGLPGDLDALVRKSLAKKAHVRPAVSELVAALLADATVTALDAEVTARVAAEVGRTWRVPDTFFPRPARRRHRVRAVVVTAALAVVAGGSGFAYWQAEGSKGDGVAGARAVTTEAPVPDDASRLPTPQAKDTDIATLLRPGTKRERVSFLEMDGRSPQEIAVVSAEHGGGAFSQRYLDVYSWRDGKWRRIFDATRYVPPTTKDSVIPFGDPGAVGGRQVNFLRGVDFYSDGSEELVAAVTAYGASSGPMELFVFSKVGSRMRTDFTHETDRGGTVTRRGDAVQLVTGEYLPTDAMCCPSFEMTALIGAAGGEIRYLDTQSEPTEYYVPPLEEASLTLNSLGGLEIGMTLAEAEAASGKQFSVGYDSGFCAQVSPINGPRGLSLMFIEGRLARFDVYEGTVETLSGIGAGSTEGDVFSTYSGRIRVEPHPYDPGGAGKYLIYEPEDAASKRYSMIFETDGRVVTSFRAGEAEAVSYIEGCL